MAAQNITSMELENIEAALRQVHVEMQKLDKLLQEALSDEDQGEQEELLKGMV